MNTLNNESNTFYFAGYDCKLVPKVCPKTNQLIVKVEAAETQDNAERGITGQHLGTMSIYAESNVIGDGEFIAKTYSENEGLLETTIIAGLVEWTRKHTIDGHPIVRLL